MVKVGSRAGTALLPREGRSSARSSGFPLLLTGAGLFVAVLGLALLTTEVPNTTLVQRNTIANNALSMHLQMLEEGEEDDLADAKIPEVEAPDQSGVEEGMVRYVIMGKPSELPACGTTHCKMMRACLVHMGNDTNCYDVGPMCPTCGTRKPCYYAFGKCRLRNGYGPKTEIQPAGNASAVIAFARNHTQKAGIDLDTKAVKRVLSSLRPTYHKDLELWNWKTRKYEYNHNYNEGVRRRWIRRKTGKYVPPGTLKEEDADKDAKDVQLEWCNWGEEMVPCAPGFGGAWYPAGKRSANYGIWPLEEESGPISHSPHSVYAGERSDSYMGHHNPIPQPDDILYGSSQDANEGAEGEEGEEGEDEKEEEGGEEEKKEGAGDEPEFTPDQKNGFIG